VGSFWGAGAGLVLWWGFLEFFGLLVEELFLCPVLGVVGDLLEEVVVDSLGYGLVGCVFLLGHCFAG
jgi:hypothetical protein